MQSLGSLDHPRLGDQLRFTGTKGAQVSQQPLKDSWAVRGHPRLETDRAHQPGIGASWLGVQEVSFGAALQPSSPSQSSPQPLWWTSPGPRGQKELFPTQSSEAGQGVGVGWRAWPVAAEAWAGGQELLSRQPGQQKLAGLPRGQEVGSQDTQAPCLAPPAQLSLSWAITSG